MYSFKNDYSEIACVEILLALQKFSENQYDGYGLDEHSLNAKKLIIEDCHRDLDIHFVAGGTCANKLIISHLLKPYEAVISAATGHINVHETGAIENTGHKVLIGKSSEGKLLPAGIREVVLAHCDEHMVLPRLVYISNTTEVGTIYSKKELIDLREVCNELHLLLFLDGARLGSALTATTNDVSLSDIASLTDVFYIGGTKNGAMYGEAICFANLELANNFRFSTKNVGAMLAKGFVTALQFEVLFTDRLFYKLAHHANNCALRIKEGLESLGVKFNSDSYSNQQFPIFSRNVVNKLGNDYLFEIIEEKSLQEVVIRFVTSFATSSSRVEELIKRVKELL